MISTLEIGTQCYGLLISPYDPEFLLPIQIKIMDKFVKEEQVYYKVKVLDMLETNFRMLKDHLPAFKVCRKKGSDIKSTLIKKADFDSLYCKDDVIKLLEKDYFFIEGNFVRVDKDGLKELYNDFVKYIINYHYKRLYDLTSRSFLANTPVFENQKDMFEKRVKKIGFGDMFDKYGIKLAL